MLARSEYSWGHQLGRGGWSQVCLPPYPGETASVDGGVPTPERSRARGWGSRRGTDQGFTATGKVPLSSLLSILLFSAPWEGRRERVLCIVSLLCSIVNLKRWGIYEFCTSLVPFHSCHMEVSSGMKSRAGPFPLGQHTFTWIGLTEEWGSPGWNGIKGIAVRT